ncbi:Uncharacterised protein [Yersinia pekkanenii]|uniref:Uncharacterized protein n=1 Tax=Yersinia pekkanenii TaxID=1288385 RepID=A0ABM9TZ51_9GAMM|nr:Uncharacterised protein [Yersinia pekkanenii]
MCLCGFTQTMLLTISAVNPPKSSQGRGGVFGLPEFDTIKTAFNARLIMGNRKIN